MSYASQADIEERNADELDRLLDRDEDDNLPAATIERGLQDASDEIDSYLGQRFSLPLPTIPNILTLVCIDIALYHLASGSRMREELETRRDKQVAWLKLVAKGDVSIGLPIANEPPPPNHSSIEPFTNDFAGWSP